MRNGFIEGVRRGDTSLSPAQFLSFLRLNTKAESQIPLLGLMTRVDSSTVKRKDVGNWMKALKPEARRNLYQIAAKSTSPFWRDAILKNRSKEPLRKLQAIIDAWKA